MKTSTVTFAQVRQLLRDLQFTETRQKKGWRFEEPESGAIFLYRPYRDKDRFSNSDLAMTQRHLEWRGLASPEAFERLLHKTPA